MIYLIFEEFKKLYIRRPMGLVFLVVLALTFNTAFNNVYRHNFNMPVEDALFTKLIREIEGDYDAEVHDEIRALSKEYDQRHEEIMNSLFTDSPDLEGIKTLHDLEPKSNVYTLLLFYLDFVSEDPGSRKVLDNSGWTALFLVRDLDFILIGFIIVLSALSVYIESPSQMNVIIDATYLGRKKTIMSKIIVVYGSILLLILIPEAFKLYLNFPSGWHYPNASNPYFSLSIFSLSLGQTYLLVLFMKFLALSFFASLVMLLVQKSRNFILSVMLPFLVTFVPSYLNPYSFFEVARMWIPTNLMAPLYWIGNGFQKEHSIFATQIHMTASFIGTTLVLTILMVLYSIKKKKVLH